MKRVLIYSVFILSSVLAQPVIAQDKYNTVYKDESYLIIESAITTAKDELELLDAKFIQAMIKSAEAEIDRAGNATPTTSDIVRTELAEIEIASVQREIDAVKLKLKELEDLALKYGYRNLIWRN